MPHEGNLLQAAVVFFLFAAVLTVPLAKRLQLGGCIGLSVCRGDHRAVGVGLDR